MGHIARAARRPDIAAHIPATLTTRHNPIHPQRRDRHRHLTRRAARQQALRLNPIAEMIQQPLLTGPPVIARARRIPIRRRPPIRRSRHVPSATSRDSDATATPRTCTTAAKRAPTHPDAPNASPSRDAPRRHAQPASHTGDSPTCAPRCASPRDRRSCGRCTEPSPAWSPTRPPPPVEAAVTELPLHTQQLPVIAAAPPQPVRPHTLGRPIPQHPHFFASAGKSSQAPTLRTFGSHRPGCEAVCSAAI